MRAAPIVGLPIVPRLTRPRLDISSDETNISCASRDDPMTGSDMRDMWISWRDVPARKLGLLSGAPVDCMF